MLIIDYLNFMNNLKKKIQDNYLFGAIKYNNISNIYLMPIAWWILNYKKYDPFYEPHKWDYVFRNHIYNVNDDLVDSFLKTIEEDKVSFKDVKLLRESTSNEKLELYFFIDFDRKEFVSSFADIEIEDYLPDSNWVGISGNPIIFLYDLYKPFFS